jgi:hypothetical protein
MCKFAIDLGGTNKMASSWAMLAPTASPPPRSLSGEARCGSTPMRCSAAGAVASFSSP